MPPADIGTKCWNVRTYPGLLKIKFDSNQPYQSESTNAVLGLFDGQPLSSGAFEFAMVAGILLNSRRVSNIKGRSQIVLMELRSMMR